MKHSIADDHLKEDLALYALGALSQFEARALEQHLADGCEVCESELKPFESVVESLAFASPSVAPPAELRQKLASLLAEETSSPMKEALKFYSLRANEGAWRETAAGVLEKELFVDPIKGTVTTLIRMKPGTRCPSHRHIGTEECLVLEGDFHVNDEVFRAGDYRSAPPNSIDQFPSSIDGNLLLIVSHGGYEAVVQ